MLKLLAGAILIIGVLIWGVAMIIRARDYDRDMPDDDMLHRCQNNLVNGRCIVCGRDSLEWEDINDEI